MKNKIIATIEIILLSFMFLFNGFWVVWFKNKRADWQLVTKRMPSNRKQKAVSYLEKLYNQ